MKIFVEPHDAAERLEELIALAQRNDAVLICREGVPFALLAAARADLDRSSDRRQAPPAGKGPPRAGQMSSHNDMSASIELPR